MIIDLIALIKYQELLYQNEEYTDVIYKIEEYSKDEIKNKRPKGKELVRGGNNFIEMKKKYKIISPKTETNCFYHCLIMAQMNLKGE